MIRTLREAPEVGAGTCKYVDVPLPKGVLAHRADCESGTMLFLHNLSTEPAKADLSSVYGEAEHPNDVLADQEYDEPGGLEALEVAGYGYRWIRLKRTS
jgi:maltose alpha-D-glucosyltransferase/alpha-amylase